MGPFMSKQTNENAEQIAQEMALHWQLGNWHDLVELYQQNDISTHPDRNRLAVLASVGLCQQGDWKAARLCLAQALRAGASPAEVLPLMACGVHNTLGLARLIKGQADHAHQHFQQAILEQRDATGAQIKARSRTQSEWLIQSFPRLGHTVELLRGAAQYEPLEYASDADRAMLAQAWQYWASGEWAALAKVDSASLDRNPDRAELVSLAAAGYQQLNDVESEQRCIHLALEWGMAKHWLKLLLISGVHNRMARAATLARRYEDAGNYFRKAVAVRSMKHVPKLRHVLHERIETQLEGLEKEDIKQVKGILGL